jgi:hypothetical protein
MLGFLASNSCSCTAIAALYNCYSIINNVVGYIEGDSKNVTGYFTEVKETPILLKEEESNVRKVRQGTPCGSANKLFGAAIPKKCKWIWPVFYRGNILSSYV